MLKHDTMIQYVSDRAPRLAPRTIRRADWTVGAMATEGRRRAHGVPSTVVVDLTTRRLDRVARVTLAGILA